MLLAVDMTRYDSLQTMYALLEGKIDDMKKISDQKDGLLQDCQASRDRLNTVISNQQAQLAQTNANFEAANKEWDRKYKASVRVGRFELVLLGGAISFALYEALKK